MGIKARKAQLEKEKQKVAKANNSGSSDEDEGYEHAGGGVPDDSKEVTWTPPARTKRPAGTKLHEMKPNWGGTTPASSEGGKTGTPLSNARKRMEARKNKLEHKANESEHVDLHDKVRIKKTVSIDARTETIED